MRPISHGMPQLTGGWLGRVEWTHCNWVAPKVWRKRNTADKQTLSLFFTLSESSTINSTSELSDWKLITIFADLKKMFSFYLSVNILSINFLRYSLWNVIMCDFYLFSVFIESTSYFSYPSEVKTGLLLIAKKKSVEKCIIQLLWVAQSSTYENVVKRRKTFMKSTWKVVFFLFSSK